MKNSKKPNTREYVSSFCMKNLSKFILKKAERSPLVFLDTGAIIEFEKLFNSWKKGNPRVSVTDFYSPLLENYKIFTTETVIDEICGHYKMRPINSRLKISENTYELIGRFHKNYCNFIKEISMTKKSYDKVRYDVRNAGAIAKLLRDRAHPKKKHYPGLSVTDTEVLSTAAWLRYASFYDLPSTTSTLILGTDSLLETTTDILCDRIAQSINEFGRFEYDNINTINIGNDKKWL